MLNSDVARYFEGDFQGAIGESERSLQLLNKLVSAYGKTDRYKESRQRSEQKIENARQAMAQLHASDSENLDDSKD